MTINQADKLIASGEPTTIRNTTYRETFRAVIVRRDRYNLYAADGAVYDRAELELVDRIDRAKPIDGPRTIAAAEEYDRVSYGPADARKSGIVSHTETRDGVRVIVLMDGGIVGPDGLPNIRGK